MATSRAYVALFAMAIAGACSWGSSVELTHEQRERVSRDLLTRAPVMCYPVDADLDGEVVYLGLDASPVPVEPGKPLTLVHYWKVEELIFDWNVFVHLLHGDGTRKINADHVPVDGLYPPSLWEKGEIIRDEHTVEIPAEVGGEIVVLVGLWRGGTRLEVRTGPVHSSNRVLAARLPVLGGREER